MLNNKKIYIIIICAVITVFFSSGLEQQEPLEELNIVSAIGLDINTTGNHKESVVPMSMYLFEPQDKIESVVKTGAGLNIAETRQNRQLMDNKQTILGLEKVVVISEQQALSGIDEGVDSLFRNPFLNDTAYVVVCKGSALDMLNLNVKGYASSGDYIEGLIKNSIYYNFFSNSYRIIDMFFAIDSEGRNFVLPYIEITDKGIQITGMALFDKYKMVAKINLDELRTMNIMREENVKGTLSIQKNDKESISYDATSKKKIYCTKIGDKYKFIINIDLNGDIVTDTLYKNIQSDPNQDAEFNKKMSEKVKKNCDDFIIKMKNDYKVDCLQLGQVAAAKYGRQTGVDWDSIVCNSEIEVNVKVNVQKTGRKDY